MKPRPPNHGRPLPEYPFAPHYFDLGGVRMHYVDEGGGPPVVMVHGNPTWSYYYRDLVVALRPAHRCIAPDHVGCGWSDKPPDEKYEYTLDRRVHDFEALMDHLGIRDGASLVVHDWGGMIAIAAALRRIERFERVVVLNTGAFRNPAAKRLPLPLWIARNTGALASFLVQGLNAFAVGLTWTGSARGLTRQVRRGYRVPYNSWANRIATLRFVQDIPLSPADPAFATVQWVDENLHRLAQKPMMIGWGRKDYVFDDHFLAEWRRRFPLAGCHIFEDAGHLVLEDAKADLIPLIREFLSPTP